MLGFCESVIGVSMFVFLVRDLGVVGRSLGVYGFGGVGGLFLGVV